MMMMMMDGDGNGIDYFRMFHDATREHAETINTFDVSISALAASPPLPHPALLEPGVIMTVATDDSSALSSVPSTPTPSVLSSSLLHAFRFVQSFRKVSRDGLLQHGACGRLTAVVPCSKCCNLTR